MSHVQNRIIFLTEPLPSSQLITIRTTAIFLVTQVYNLGIILRFSNLPTLQSFCHLVISTFTVSPIYALNLLPL